MPTPSQLQQANAGARATAKTETATRNMPAMSRGAELQPASFSDADNSVDCIWTTGSRVRRYDWWNEIEFEEELEVSPAAVDMTRFDAGVVHVLDEHQTYGGVKSILGVASRASISNGQGLATLRMSVRPELAGIVADIKAGIIRSISFGYTVQKYEITRAIDRTDGINMPLYRAIAWQPHEISFVTVPADPDASTRSQPNQTSSSGAPCEFSRALASITKEINMTPEEIAAAAAAAAELKITEANRAADLAKATAAAKTAADAAVAVDIAQRAADITELCVRHNAPGLAAGMIRSGATVDQARSAVLEELAKRDVAAGGQRNVRIETVTDEHQTRMAGMEEAVIHRVNSRSVLTDNGRQYRGLSLLELGREFLASRGVETRGMDRLRIATEMLQYRSGGMHTTSDFSNLFANVANKRLRAAYDENRGTYDLWARRAPNAPDFKNISVAQLSGAPDLLKTNEHGEFKYGTMTDAGETYAVLTYGRIVGLSRQAIINDDLRSFDRLVGAFGNSSRRLENRTVYSQLTGNAAMSDSVALFHADHANLGTGAGSALQMSALTAARTAMRLQKGIAGEELNLAPNFLICPASLEQTAYQLTSSNYVPAKQSDTNEFRAGGRTAITPIIEPILDALSSTAWYMASDSGQVDTVEYCYLDGAEGPVIESEIGFETDGISYKCRLDFAAKAIDHRGLYKAAGA